MEYSFQVGYADLMLKVCNTQLIEIGYRLTMKILLLLYESVLRSVRSKSL